MPSYVNYGTRDLLEVIANNTGGTGSGAMDVISKYKSQETIVPEKDLTLVANTLKEYAIVDKDIEFVVTSGSLYVNFVETVTLVGGVCQNGFLCNQGTVIQIHVAQKVSMISTGTAKAQIMIYSV